MMVEIKAPVDGPVIAVHVKLGEQVSKDTYLFTLEKAKTLLIVRATVDGKVSELNIAPGDEVDIDFVAVRIE